MRSSWYRGIPVVVLVAVAVWSSWRVVSAGSDVPGDDAWKAAAAAVRARHWKGDLIVFAPDWIDPVGRMHLGDLIPIDAAGRMDAARYATIWELSIRGAQAPEARGAQAPEARGAQAPEARGAQAPEARGARGLRTEWSGAFDGLRVRRLVQTPADVATDFVATLATARTEGSASRGPAVVLAEVGFAPRRCVQVVPQPGQSVTITWSSAELGAELVGYVGLADVFTRRDVREPGELAVRIGDREVAKVRAGVDDGWVRFAAPTTPGRADVAFVATAVGPKARDRLICFAAEARR